VEKANWTRCRKLGFGSVLRTEGTSDAASRHGRKSKETPHFQRTEIIKAKFLHELKKNPPGNVATALNKETQQTGRKRPTP
jgi:hypothetical protein